MQISSARAESSTLAASDTRQTPVTSHDTSNTSKTLAHATSPASTAWAPPSEDGSSPPIGRRDAPRAKRFAAAACAPGSCKSLAQSSARRAAGRPPAAFVVPASHSISSS
jgi:hypothetical protein